MMGKALVLEDSIEMAREIAQSLAQSVQAAQTEWEHKQVQHAHEHAHKEEMERRAAIARERQRLLRQREQDLTREIALGQSERTTRAMEASAGMRGHLQSLDARAAAAERLLSATLAGAGQGDARRPPAPRALRKLDPRRG